MKNLCKPKDQRFLEQINKDIVSGPTLARPETHQRLYINTYWYKDRIGSVLLQSDDSAEERNPEAQEKDCGKCEFDKFLEIIHLHPIYFISRTVSPLKIQDITF